MSGLEERAQDQKIVEYWRQQVASLYEKGFSKLPLPEKAVCPHCKKARG